MMMIEDMDGDEDPSSWSSRPSSPSRKRGRSAEGKQCAKTAELSLQSTSIPVSQWYGDTILRWEWSWRWSRWEPDDNAHNHGQNGGNGDALILQIAVVPVLCKHKVDRTAWLPPLHIHLNHHICYNRHFFALPHNWNHIECHNCHTPSPMWSMPTSSSLILLKSSWPSLSSWPLSLSSSPRCLSLTQRATERSPQSRRERSLGYWHQFG